LPPRRLGEGSIVAGRFRLERLLGEGGMGAVWAARHVVTQRGVALKFLKGPASPDSIQRFWREAQAANAVQHPNVVTVHDVFELEDGIHAMVMDLLEGESLAERLEQGAFSVRDLSQTMAPVVSAILAIHAAGIVHRDLKPANVFLAQRSDGSLTPMLLDFGICKLDSRAGGLLESDVCTTAGRVMGRPCYMSPEQVRSADVDEASDVWALGVMLYECATGSVPWEGDSLTAVISAITTTQVAAVERLAPHLPGELASVINRMLARDRNERLTDLSEVLAALRNAASSTAVPAPAQKTRVRRRVAPARSEAQRQPRPQPERVVETVAALRVSRAANESRRVRPTLYFSGVFALSALLGGLVAFSANPSAQALQPALGAAAVLVPSAPAAPATPAPVAPSPLATASKTTAAPAAAPSAPSKKRRAPLRPVTNFGGRR
jgi:serine/threonine-protein kinase